MALEILSGKSHYFPCGIVCPIGIASESADCMTAAAHISRIPVKPIENKVKAVRFLLREKLILAREQELSLRPSFFVSPIIVTSDAVVILTASTGETDIAICTSLRIDRWTVTAITKAVRTANLTVFGQYQPPGRIRYPMIQPPTIPRGIENSDIFLLSFFTRRFICLCVIPTARRL